MAAPGFGFSAGDFIAATKLLVDVSKALKDAGGASDEYRQVLAEFNLIKDAITQLQATQAGSASETPNSLDDPFATYAKKQASLTLETLTSFLESISKFNAKLGPKAKPGWFRGANRKAQWAVIQAGEVAKLRTTLGTQLHVLNMLLQFQNDQSQSPKSRTNADVVSTPLTAPDEDMTVSGLEQSLTARLDTMSTAIEGFAKSQRTEHENQCQQIITAVSTSQSKDVCKFISEATKAIKASDNNQNRRFKQLATKENELHEVMLQQFINFSESHAKDVAKLVQRTERTIEAASVFMTNYSEPLSMRTAQEDDAYDLMARLLKLTRATIKSLLIRTWSLLPQFWETICILNTNLRREPVLLVSDSISFEDVLGRNFVLQYDFYRHWPQFDAFLRRQFCNLPGETLVTTGRYMLHNSQDPGKTIPNDRWNLTITRGSKILMSVEAQLQEQKTQVCPRPACGGEFSSRESTTQKCPKCGFRFFLVESVPTLPQKPGPREAIGKSSTREGSNGRLSTGEDLEMFRQVYQVLTPESSQPLRTSVTQKEPENTEEALLFGKMKDGGGLPDSDVRGRPGEAPEGALENNPSLPSREEGVSEHGLRHGVWPVHYVQGILPQDERDQVHLLFAVLNGCAHLYSARRR